MGGHPGGPLRRRLLVVVALMAALVAAAAAAGGLGQELERTSVDARFALRGTTPVPRDLVVVGIDDVTFSELQEQWPFSRRRHAQVIDRLRRDGARVIAFDVQFTEPSDDPAADDALLRASRRAGNVVLATTEVDDAGRTNVFGEALAFSRARVGDTTFVPDPGDVVRRIDRRPQGLDAFALVAARAAGAPAVRWPADAAWIDFHGPPRTIPSLSYSRVLRGRFEPGTFRGKVVVVGPVAPSLQDVHPTSTTGASVMAGAEIQANAISTVSRGLPLRDAPGVVGALLVVLLAALPPLLAARLRIAATLAGAVLGAVVLVGAVQIAFEQGRVVPLVHPLIAFGVATVGAISVHALVAAVERERVRDVFARFVPESVVEQVLDEAGGELRLGGVERDVTVMFSDLRGFTSYAEGRPASTVIEVLNRYLTSMSDAILDHGGTLVAYMGDGIMAVFGAPVAQDDHADRALRAAREMLARLEQFNAWMAEQGHGEGFRMGIGLNSGGVLSGNVGSERRLEYTAIGDTTNCAARIESMTKGTPHAILMAASTAERLRDRDGLVAIGSEAIRGRVEEIELWALRPQGAPAAADHVEAPA